MQQKLVIAESMLYWPWLYTYMYICVHKYTHVHFLKEPMWQIFLTRAIIINSFYVTAMAILSLYGHAI